MGNFGGHALPGTFFILFALWHLLQVCVHYFRAKRRCGPPFQSSTYFQTPCCSKFPMESALKLFGATGALAIEGITGFKAGKFVHIGNGQHICMYTFFGFTAFMEILQFYKFHLPHGIEYVCYALAFFVEGLLFYWHLHVQQPLEVQVHTLLLYVIMATAICVLLEMKYRRHVLPALCRTFLMLLQGVWFWQASFILYPPTGWEQWDWKSHEQMMIVTIIFCANVFASLMVVMICWFVVACRYSLIRHEITEMKNGYSPAPQTDTSFMHQINGRNEKLDFKSEDEEALISE